MEHGLPGTSNPGTARHGQEHRRVAATASFTAGLGAHQLDRRFSGACVHLNLEDSTRYGRCHRLNVLCNPFSEATPILISNFFEEKL